MRLIGAGRGFRQLPLSAGRREARIRAELLDEPRQGDRPHAFLLLPEDERRHRLRPADAVHQRSSASSVSRRSRPRTTTATRTTTSPTTKRTSGRFKLEHRFSNTLSLRNTLRLANYKRESESTIATLVRHGCERRAGHAQHAASTAARDAQPRQRAHAGQRRHALINQTELTWKSAPARSNTRCSAGSSSPTSGSTAATTCSTPIRRARRAGADLDDAVPEPGSVHGAVVYARRRTSTRSPRPTPSRSTCRTSSSSRRNGRRWSACATSTYKSEARTTQASAISGGCRPDRSRAPTTC